MDMPISFELVEGEEGRGAFWKAPSSAAAKGDEGLSPAGAGPVAGAAAPAEACPKAVKV